jgi:predicted porin
MQKKLIALAVAGLVSGGAFAQSNVTVYGVADASFESASATGANGGTNLDRRARVNSNSSYLGFKGTEALGNGLTAVFQFETGLALDGSSTAGAFAGGNNGATVANRAAPAIRDTFVGVKSDNLGTVTLGNQTGPTRALGAAIDLNSGATGPGANNGIIGKIGGQAAYANAGNNGTGLFDTRFANAIAYTSPSFSGFNAVAAYVAGENRNANAGQSSSTYGYDLGGFYNNGPIYAGLTYGRVKINDNLATTDYTSILRLAGSYQVLPALKVTALYEQNKGAGLNAGTDVKQNIWGLGAQYNVTAAGRVFGQYYQAQNTTGQANNTDTGAKLYEVGYEHSLSKRTSVRATYARIDNKNNANYDFGIGAVGNTTVGAVAAGSNPQVFGLGLRHSF